jgi:hypothetical protein
MIDNLVTSGNLFIGCDFVSLVAAPPTNISSNFFDLPQYSTFRSELKTVFYNFYVFGSGDPRTELAPVPNIYR